MAFLVRGLLFSVDKLKYLPKHLVYQWLYFCTIEGFITASIAFSSKEASLAIYILDFPGDISHFEVLLLLSYNIVWPRVPPFPTAFTGYSYVYQSKQMDQHLKLTSLLVLKT